MTSKPLSATPLGRFLLVMSSPSNLDSRHGLPSLLESGNRGCRLEFRPSRFFGYRIEKVLAEFFHTDDPCLAALPHAFFELSAGTVRPALDDRVVLDASFAPAHGRGRATLSLFYRLPDAPPKKLDNVLALLERRTTTSGYHRFGRGAEASLRGSTRVHTTVVGRDEEESHFVTTVTFGVRALIGREAFLFRRLRGPSTGQAFDSSARHEPA